MESNTMSNSNSNSKDNSKDNSINNRLLGLREFGIGSIVSYKLARTGSYAATLTIGKQSEEIHSDIFDLENTAIDQILSKLSLIVKKVEEEEAIGIDTIPKDLALLSPLAKTLVKHTMLSNLSSYESLSYLMDCYEVIDTDIKIQIMKDATNTFWHLGLRKLSEAVNRRLLVREIDSIRLELA